MGRLSKGIQQLGLGRGYGVRSHIKRIGGQQGSLHSMERGRQHTSPPVWNVLGKKFPRVEVVFFAQVFLIYIIVTSCIVNLSLGRGDSNLWTCLLSSCLGYLLPNPKLNSVNREKQPPPQDEPDVPNTSKQQLHELLPRKQIE